MVAEKYFYRIEVYGLMPTQSECWRNVGIGPGGNTYEEALSTLKKRYKESFEPGRTPAIRLRYKIVEIITKESPVFEINSPDDRTAFLLTN